MELSQANVAIIITTLEPMIRGLLDEASDYREMSASNNDIGCFNEAELDLMTAEQRKEDAKKLEDIINILTPKE